MFWKNEYWFARKGTTSVEVCRMALGLAYVIMNHRNTLLSAQAIKNSYPAQNYEPDGILMLMGSAMPSDGLIDVMILLSKIFPWLLFFGIFTRASLWGTLITHLFLRTLIESFATNWSHGFNVVFLAHIAFLFAPVGQIWSVDAWIRRLRGKELATLSDGFWAVVLGQWNVALMFASAFYWKALYNANPPFSWAHWENMRNQILTRYEWSGDPLPEHLGYLIDSPFLCGAMAWSNLLFQIMPLASLFFLHRPWLRLLFGSAFVVEELGLALVMQLADLHWLPLIAFFVDWDHFIGRTKGTLGIVMNRSVKKTFALVMIGVYLCFSLNIAGAGFGHSVFDLRAYPFSKFDMYSGQQRERDGSPFVNLGTTFRSVGDMGDDARMALERKLKRRFYGAHWAGPDELHGILAKALELANDPEWSGLPSSKVEEISAYRTLHIFRTDTDHLDFGASGLIGRARKDGTCVVASSYRYVHPDSLLIEIDHACGPWSLLSATAVDKGGSEHPLPVRVQGQKARVHRDAEMGFPYLQISILDSLRNKEEQILIECE